MAQSGTTLSWCIVQLSEDYQWWVREISDEVHWDVDGLSIIDPRQINHILDLVEPLRDYEFQPEMLEDAFFTFKIDKKLDDNKLRLVRFSDSIADADEPLFALPDIIDEDKSPYADFLDHITRLRVRMLNDLIDFERRLTVEELEEDIREEHNNHFMEGKAVHAFKELTDILEYVPAGYELDEDGADEKSEEESIDEEFPDIDDSEEESIDRDETMQWDDEEEDDDGFLDDDTSLGEDDDEDEDDEDEDQDEEDDEDE